MSKVKIVHQLELTWKPHHLHANSGEVILLSGKNGSGKTLWLNRIAGLEPLPEQMHILVNQQAVTKQPLRMLFEGWPTIWLGQTIAEELTFGLPQQVEKELITHTLARWRIPELEMETETATLNRLQSLRLNLASMDLAAPMVALLDNPTDALAVEDGAQLINDITAWAHESKTIVVVTSNRWQDWQQQASQHWQTSSTSTLPQLRGTA
ncbi:MAG: ATP-binding cassette domain-containing protein [Mariprofundus sp.]|nr:ATP-binding cassette domain-containing protein [Mariprofundus sp.]